jgi:hypothetical protein
MRKCWAASLGDCEGALSGEHIVSECVLPQRVLIDGFPWCVAEPREVDRSALTANILCRSHNSALSPLDAAAQKAFDQFREYHRLFGVRAKIAVGRRRPAPWSVAKLQIDGPLFERWMLKTAINWFFTHGKGCVWDRTGVVNDRPPEDAVRAAFGKAPLAYPMGLYAVATVGDTLKSDETLRLAEIMDGRFKSLSGTVLSRLGFRFLFWLTDKPTPGFFPDGMLGPGGRLLRHGTFVQDQAGWRSIEFDFAWPEARRGSEASTRRSP